MDIGTLMDIGTWLLRILFAIAIIGISSFFHRKQFTSLLLQHSNVKSIYVYKLLRESLEEHTMSVKPRRAFCLNLSPIAMMIVMAGYSYLKSKNFHASFFTGYFTAVMIEIGILLTISPLIDNFINYLTENPKNTDHVPVISLAGSGWSVLILLLMFPVELWVSSSLNIKSRGSLNEFLFYMLIWILPVIMCILFLKITNRATRDLWKRAIASRKVGEEIVKDLPHLTVITKNGTVFFGQLYDPLDNKFLILRNAKLVIHGGREVEDSLEKVISHVVPPEKQGNYLPIPWDNIEALQIVEKGLYVKPEPETDMGTNNEGGTSKKDTPTKPEKHSHEGK